MYIFTVLLIAVSALTSLCNSARGQNRDNMIKWQSAYKLQWADFQGVPDSVTEASALSSIIVSYTYIPLNGRYNFYTNAMFEKSRSFYLPDYVTDSTLNHEQTHFDIAAIYAEMLSRILNSRNFEKSTVRVESGRIFDSLTSELADEQKRYDFETRWGTRYQQQVSWERKIHKALVNYKMK